MSKSTKRRPYWQHDPCPDWCMGGHSTTDHPADRTHFSRWEQRLVPTLYTAESRRDPDDQERSVIEPDLITSVQQGWREIDPRVVVEPESTGHEGLGSLQLTRGEAEKLGRALLEAVDLIDGHHTGSAS